MGLPMDSRCYLCHFRRKLATAHKLGDEATVTAFARELMKLYLSAPEDAPSVWLNPATTELMDRFFGTGPDPMRRQKELSNAFVLKRLDAIRAKAHAAHDPVQKGLHLAIAGNYIDFSAYEDTLDAENLGDLDELIDSAEYPGMDEDVYARFLSELAQAKTLLYITDNAGEIVFDRVFAEILKERFPQLQITFCVRGGPAQNDATREDALAVGIPFPVIDNGTCIPGTPPELVSDECRRALETSDVIFAKGMANVETMLGCGYPIYYAFLVKCSRFAHHFRKPMSSPVLYRE